MNNLKSLRLSAKITQRALAKEMRVTQGAIAHYDVGADGKLTHPAD
ncbi:helix-turn-helix transcriptional regulator [Pseudomonas aeruginosa]|nr:helix-turn-helix transcriptional regulator [Pseudomonas aeruginosa]